MKDNNFLLCDEGEEKAAFEYAVNIIKDLKNRSLAFKLEAFSVLKEQLNKELSQLKIDMENGLEVTKIDITRVSEAMQKL